MSGPHRNHVEARSSRTPARSETHDRKPNVGSHAEAPDFFVGIPLVTNEMVLAINVLTERTKALRAAEASRQPIPVKLIAEEIERTARQVSLLAAQVARTAARHANRRPRP